MSEEYNPGLKLVSEELSQFASKEHEKNSQIPQEVFRNDTTAVEVIVKQVKNKTKVNQNEVKVDNLYKCIEHLGNEVDEAKKNLEDTKNCFRAVMFEMGKQLTAANQREFKTQTRNVTLQLENEKLRSILDSKTNLVTKLKKEMVSMRRIIKFVNRGIRCVPFVSESVSDSEYTEFERDLSKDYQSNSLNFTNNSTF